MTFRRWVIFLCVVSATFLCLELWAYFNGEPTLSQTVWHTIDLWPIFGFVFGISMGTVIGHLLWPRRIEAKQMTYFDRV